MADIEDDDLGGVVPGPGSGHEQHEDQIPDLLMAMIMQCTQLLTLLQESDADEFKRYRGRLKVLQNLMGQIPKDMPPRKRLGFKVKAK